ncbi:hypothetical protein GZH49_37685 [Nocardia terpenica]|uniref:hypothetical protein n=1 Tax=Nocardia terpenica TaxID=455432 RepID=UPI002FE327E0
MQRSSSKAKGWPLDHWRDRELGSRPYLHAVGFNADEGRRIVRDNSVTLGGRRRPIYPLHAAGRSRQRCSDYLYGLFGIRWPKSCCRQCCFVSAVSGWPDQLARFRAAPQESYRHVVDEFVTVALNRNSPLFGRAGTLADRLARGNANLVLALADRDMAAAEWALYRVRRLYYGRAQAIRSLHITCRGTRQQMAGALRSVAAALDIQPLTEAGHTRLWLARRPDSDRYP